MNEIIDTCGNTTNVLDPNLVVVYVNVGGLTTQQIIRKISSDCDRCFSRADIKRSLRGFQDFNSIKDGACFAFLATHVAGGSRVLIQATYQASTKESKQHTFLVGDVVYDDSKVWPEQTLAALKRI